MEISFEKKIVMVVGAGRGVGRFIAKEFVKCKAAKVFALSITKEHLDTLVEEEPSIIPVCADLTNYEEVCKEIEKLGYIDILINNAAYLHLDSFLNMSLEHVDQHFQINYKAQFNITRTVARGMVESGKRGAIINISSRSSLTGVKGLSAYGSMKGALDCLTRNLAVELGPHKIRVNSVNPGLVDTDMANYITENKERYAAYVSGIPLGRICEPVDVSNVVLFLASEKSNMINGVTLPVDGGSLIKG